jgi:hypothetical protein
VPFPGEAFAGVSCAPSSTAAKRFGAGDVAPAVSLSMIVTVAVPGAPNTAPTGLLSVTFNVSFASTKASSTIRTLKVLLVSLAAKLQVPLLIT